MSARAAEFPLVRAFRAIAAELLTAHNQTTCLAVLDMEDSMFIDLEETSHPVRLVTQVGSRTPAFASASGRVILADRAPQVVAAQYAGRTLVTPTGRRLRGVAELLEILEHVRRDGYAENNGETADGLSQRREHRPCRAHHVHPHLAHDHGPPGAPDQTNGGGGPASLRCSSLASGMERHPGGNARAGSSLTYLLPILLPTCGRHKFSLPLVERVGGY
jgi:transcriptional regulator